MYSNILILGLLFFSMTGWTIGFGDLGRDSGGRSALTSIGANPEEAKGAVTIAKTLNKCNQDHKAKKGESYAALCARLARQNIFCTFETLKKKGAKLEGKCDLDNAQGGCGSANNWDENDKCIKAVEECGYKFCGGEKDSGGGKVAGKTPESGTSEEKCDMASDKQVCDTPGAILIWTKTGTKAGAKHGHMAVRCVDDNGKPSICGNHGEKDPKNPPWGPPNGCFIPKKETMMAASKVTPPSNGQTQLAKRILNKIENYFSYFQAFVSISKVIANDRPFCDQCKKLYTIFQDADLSLEDKVKDKKLADFKNSIKNFHFSKDPMVKDREYKSLFDISLKFQKIDYDLESFAALNHLRKKNQVEFDRHLRRQPNSKQKEIKRSMVLISAVIKYGQDSGKIEKMVKRYSP